MSGSGPKAVGGKSRVWVLPLDAETLDVDGAQLWYATTEGLGSAASIGEVAEFNVTYADGDEPEA